MINSSIRDNTNSFLTETSEWLHVYKAGRRMAQFRNLQTLLSSYLPQFWCPDLSVWLWKKKEVNFVDCRYDLMVSKIYPVAKIKISRGIT